MAARQLSVPIKILAFSVSYRLYEPGGNLVDYGYESEAVVLRLERGPSLVAPIESSSVRIVYNRLEAAGVLYDRALAGTAKAITLKRTVIVQRVPVNVNLSMEASYDEDGFLDSAKGVMYTTVLVYDYARGAYVPSGEGEFSFEAGTLAALKREGGPLSLAVAALAFAAVAVCAVSLDNVLRKSGELEILA